MTQTLTVVKPYDSGTVATRCSELFTKYEFESFRGKDFQNDLLVTPPLPQFKQSF